MLSKDLDLTMVADLSHWVNVAETDTNDPDLTAVIEAFADRFRHIHLRVGYDHGPQVNVNLFLFHPRNEIVCRIFLLVGKLRLCNIFVGTGS